MYKVVSRIARNPQLVMTPQTSCIYEIKVSNIGHNIVLKGCCTWEEIYNMFFNGEFPKNDPYLKIFQNIHKRNIHTIVAQPTIFPYNEVPRWDYKNVNTHAQTITNKKWNTISPLN